MKIYIAHGFKRAENKSDRPFHFLLVQEFMSYDTVFTDGTNSDNLTTMKKSRTSRAPLSVAASVKSVVAPMDKQEP